MNEELTAEITYSDSRYPQLILRGLFGTRGYWINTDFGYLEQFCVCSAWSKNECICGCWDDDEDDYDE